MSHSLSVEFKVGVTTILALIILIGGTMWVKRFNPVVKRVTVTVAFADARGIAPGDPVTISGIIIGEVKKIALDPQNLALVSFAAPQSMAMGDDTRFVIQDVGLMGDKALVVIPGASDRPLDTTIVHPGDAGADLSVLFARADSLARRFDRIAASVESDLDFAALSASVTASLDAVRAATEEIGRTAELTREPVISSLAAVEAAAVDIRELAGASDTKITAAIDGLEAASRALASTLETFDATATSVDTLARMMTTGGGTVSRLVTTDDLYRELRATNAAIDSFVTDFRRDPGKYTKDMNFKVRLF